MPKLDMILELLRTDLSAPKVLIKQVIDEINDRHAFTEDRLADFFAQKFPTLEDYQVDLLFSPQYTPSEHNRLDYIPFIGADALTEDDVKSIKRQLTDEKLSVRFSTPDEGVEATVTVHEVFIDRYVDLLKLDQPLPESAYQDIQAMVPEASRNEVNLVARDAVWQPRGRYDILKAFLALFHANKNFSTVKVSYLSNFVRTYRPEDLNDVARQLDALVASCKKDRDQAEGRGFMDEGLKALNSDNPIPQHTVQEIRDHYQQMIDVAEALQQDLASSPKFVAPSLSVVTP
jgi:hypothetical protein